MASEQRPDYTAGSPFVELLAREGRVRMLDVFLRKHSTELSQSEIARLADIHPSTVGRNIDQLVQMDIVEVTENGESDRYRLNLENDLVTALGQFHTALLEHAESIDPTDQEQRLRNDDTVKRFLDRDSSERADEKTRLKEIASQTIADA